MALTDFYRHLQPPHKKTHKKPVVFSCDRGRIDCYSATEFEIMHPKKKAPKPPIRQRLHRAVVGHLRATGIALVFGMTAYGAIHLLIRAMAYVEKF